MIRPRVHLNTGECLERDSYYSSTQSTALCHFFSGQPIWEVRKDTIIEMFGMELGEGEEQLNLHHSGHFCLSYNNSETGEKHICLWSKSGESQLELKIKIDLISLESVLNLPCDCHVWAALDKSSPSFFFEGLMEILWVAFTDLFIQWFGIFKCQIYTF